MGAQRQHMGDILIRPDNDKSTAQAVNPAQIEYVQLALQVRTEHLLVVAQAIAPFEWPQEGTTNDQYVDLRWR